MEDVLENIIAHYGGYCDERCVLCEDERQNALLHDELIAITGDHHADT